MWLFIHALISTLKLWYGWVIAFHSLCCNIVIYYHNSLWVQFIYVSKIGPWNLWRRLYFVMFWLTILSTFPKNTNLSFTEEGAWKCLPETTISLMMIYAFNMIQRTCNFYSNWFYHVHCGFRVIENKPDCVQICTLLYKRLNGIHKMKRCLCLLQLNISIICSYLSSNILVLNIKQESLRFNFKMASFVSFVITFSTIKISCVDLSKWPNIFRCTITVNGNTINSGRVA